MADVKRKATPASQGRPNGVTPKRGPGPKGGIPREFDKRLAVSAETFQGLSRLTGELFPAYGREVTIGEAAGVAAERLRKALSTKAGRAEVLEKVAKLPPRRIGFGKAKGPHISPETNVAVVEITGVLMTALGRKVTAGEAMAMAVEFALGDLGTKVE